MYTIDEMEQRRRREAIDFARANVELSGFDVSKFMLEAAGRYANGEISLDDFLCVLRMPEKNANSVGMSLRNNISFPRPGN